MSTLPIGSFIAGDLAIKTILLADDDTDDCLLFNEALKELSVTAQLITVFNGEQLMQLLNSNALLPDILFLDLNMPRKNGFDCLQEIKSNEKLKKLPVVTFSTSYESTIVNRLFENGAQYYIRKPNEFSKLKELILRALTLTTQACFIDPSFIPAATSKQDFVLSN